MGNYHAYKYDMSTHEPKITITMLNSYSRDAVGWDKCQGSSMESCLAPQKSGQPKKSRSIHGKKSSSSISPPKKTTTSKKNHVTPLYQSISTSWIVLFFFLPIFSASMICIISWFRSSNSRSFLPKVPCGSKFSPSGEVGDGKCRKHWSIETWHLQPGPEITEPKSANKNDGTLLNMACKGGQTHTNSSSIMA